MERAEADAGGRAVDRLAGSRAWPSPAVIVLRGIGQVMFQRSAYAGALFLAGIAYRSRADAVATVAGAAVSTLVARGLGADRGKVSDGLYGFNGALVALALVHFLGASAFSLGFAAFAAACAALLTASFTSLFARSGGSALTSPFVLTTWAFLLAAPRFARLASSSPASATLPAVPSDLGSLMLEGTFKGIGQVFFQDDVISGALFMLGLLVASRTFALATLLGSLVGLGVAVTLGASEQDARLGLFGFNSALAALALGGVFFPLAYRSVALALLGAVAAAIGFAALSSALAPIGVAPLTAPFVLVVWAVLGARSSLSKLRTSASGS